MTDEEARELIKRRRLQMVVHSYIYYQLNDNIIPDSLWSKWAMELKELQDKYPDIASQEVYADYFKGWDGSTGYGLPDDLPTVSRAHSLLKEERKRRNQ